MMEMSNVVPMRNHLDHVAALRNQQQAVKAMNANKNSSSRSTGMIDKIINENNNKTINKSSATNNKNKNRKSGKSSNSKSSSTTNKNRTQHLNTISEEEGAAAEQGKVINTGRWSQDEHTKFLSGLDRYGNGNWKKITEMVGTRSCTQIRTHAQKYFIALQKPQQENNGINGSNSIVGGRAGSCGVIAAAVGAYNANIKNGSKHGNKTGSKKRKNSTSPSKSNSKLLMGAPQHHVSAKIRTGSSAIITGYGGGGTPIHPSGIVPVTSNLLDVDGGGPGGGSVSSSSLYSSRHSSQRSSPVQQGWRGGLSGIDVLAQAAIVENNKNNGGGAFNGFNSKSTASTSSPLAKEKIKETAASVVAQAMAQVEAQEAAEVAAAAKRKRDERLPITGRNSSVTGIAPTSSSSTFNVNAVIAAQQILQSQHQQQLELQQSTNKKLRLANASSVTSPLPATSSPSYFIKQNPSSSIVDRNDVLEKLQAVAERQEYLRLRQEVKNLNHTILELQQQSIESDNRVMEAITDRRLALNECKNLQEVNIQLKAELRRMVLLFDQLQAQTQQQARQMLSQSNSDGDAAAANIKNIIKNAVANNDNGRSDSTNKSNNSALALEAAAQGANADLMKAKLTESELRYHALSESLSRQTGILSDQHRAIVELTTNIEQERAKRQAVEFELNQLKAALQQHHQQQTIS